MSAFVRRAVVIGLCGLLVGGGAAAAQEGPSLDIESIDASAYPTISMEVGGPPGLEIAGYPPDAFVVTEDGNVVDATVARVETTNLEVLLVIDTSGSMRGLPLVAAKDAATKFLNVLPPDVRVGAVAFGAQATLLATPTTDRIALGAAIGSLEAAGDTALYDAVVFSGDQFTDQADDKALVLLSDGADTASYVDLPLAVEVASSGVRVSVVSLVTETTNADALAQIAAAGGGTVSAVSDPNALGDLFSSTASALVNRYAITYPSSAHDDTTVTVRLTTSTGVLEASTSVPLPPAPAAPAPPPPTAPPATAAPEPTPPPTPAPVQYPIRQGDPTAARTRLIAGLAAVFVAIVLVVFIAMPQNVESRRARANLRLRSSIDTVQGASARERAAASAERIVHRTGRSSALQRGLAAAGISTSVGEFVLIVCAAALLVGFVGFLAGGFLVAFLGLLLVPIVAQAYVRSRINQRREAFLEQLPDTMQVLTSTLRAGYGLLQALDSVAGQAQQPMRGELQRVLLEQRVGRDLVDSLQSLASEMDSKDLTWVAGAIEINRDVGGDLAGILDHVAATIRERRRLVRQVQSLSAEGRISAYVLIALPPVVAGLMALMSPDYLDTLGTPIGLTVVGGAAGLMVVGWFWIRRLIRIEY